MVLHRLDALELDQVLIAAGFPKEDTKDTTSPEGLWVRRTAWAKAMAESSGYYDIIGGPNPNGSYDYGLFQINEAVHRPGIGEEGWKHILEPEFNANLAFKWSGGGKNWGTWGLGLTGWAGSLHESNLSNWQLIQDIFQRWYDRYPADIAAALELRSKPSVAIANLKPGRRNPNVSLYQKHLRLFLANRNRLGNLNPSGIRGYYGSETKAMTDAVYRYQAIVTRDLGWLRGDLTIPGPKMLAVIGLQAV